VIRVVQIAAISLVLSRSLIAESVEQSFVSARHLLQIGQYDEAIDAYRELLSGDDLQAETDRDAAIGLSMALEARGLADMARQVVQDGLKRQPQDAVLLARLAQLQYQRGEFDDAETTAAAALKVDGDQLLARLIRNRAAR